MTNVSTAHRLCHLQTRDRFQAGAQPLPAECFVPAMPDRVFNLSVDRQATEHFPLGLNSSQRPTLLQVLELPAVGLYQSVEPIVRSGLMQCMAGNHTNGSRQLQITMHSQCPTPYGLNKNSENRNDANLMMMSQQESMIKRKSRDHGDLHRASRQDAAQQFQGWFSPKFLGRSIYY
eukprot:scpid99628/ scgid23703/ 